MELGKYDKRDGRGSSKLMLDLTAMSLGSWPRLAWQGIRERRGDLVSVTDVRKWEALGEMALCL